MTETFTDDEVRVLRSMARGMLTAMKRDGVAGVSATAMGAAAGGVTADDAELDGDWGNPVVRLTLKKWTGDSCKGKSYSECPVEFLDMLASTLDWMADNPQAGKDPKYVGFNRKDAARARGWAARLRRRNMDDARASVSTLPMAEAQPSSAKRQHPKPAREPGDDFYEIGDVDGIF
jgi:hypothetical protein